MDGEYAPDWKQQGHNYVAKSYIEGVARDVYFEDVRLQMDAKLWGEEYNRHSPPKKVDVLQMSVLEFKDRPDSPLFHLEHFIDGDYIKYNSNSGFVEESIRLTPQAFSHFTFERSGHSLIVVDVQGVGDLWTDPQIHTADGRGYGDGNLGTRGMALFFHSHACNNICAALALSRFDLAPSEMRGQTNFIRRSQDAVTRVRGSEEICRSASPKDIGGHFGPMFLGEGGAGWRAARRNNRTSSEYSSGPSDDSGFDEQPMKAKMYVEGEDEEDMSFSLSPVSPLSPVDRPRRFLADSDDSNSASASITEEEETRRFRGMARSASRPSCVALQADNLRGLHQRLAIGESVLGQIHHDLALYHELGRFLACRDDPFDVDAALFHERQAATLGFKPAIVALASIHLGLPHDTLASISVEATSANIDAGVEYMLSAAEAGDRGAMLYLAKAYESGNGLGSNREQSYTDAAEWYEKAARTSAEDESGEFDATMDDPLYQLKAAIARLYLSGGFGLDKDPSYAGELYTEAAECATAAMKGRLASKYFALAEEAWAQVEG